MTSASPRLATVGCSRRPRTASCWSIPDTRQVFDANPFLTDLLGYGHDELVGKELWEIGLFQDIASSKEAFRTLQEKGTSGTRTLPLQTKDGRHIEVEFVSNVYNVR